MISPLLRCSSPGAALAAQVAAFFIRFKCADLVSHYPRLVRAATDVCTETNIKQIFFKVAV